MNRQSPNKISEFFFKIKKLYGKADSILRKLTHSVIVSNLFIAVISIPMFYGLFYLNAGNSNTIYLGLISFVVVKCGYFVLYSLENIAKTYTHDKSYNWFLLRFTGVFFLIVLSFGADNFVLFLIDKENFKNVPLGAYFQNGFDFLHYSFMTLTTVGFGEIVGSSRIAKLLSLIQVFTGFVLVTYLLAGFTGIREALIKDQTLGIDYDRVRRNFEMTNGDQANEA